MKWREGAADRKLWKERTERVARQYFTWSPPLYSREQGGRAHTEREYGGRETGVGGELLFSLSLMSGLRLTATPVFEFFPCFYFTDPVTLPSAPTVYTPLSLSFSTPITLPSNLSSRSPPVSVSTFLFSFYPPVSSSTDPFHSFYESSPL